MSFYNNPHLPFQSQLLLATFRRNPLLLGATLGHLGLARGTVVSRVRPRGKHASWRENVVVLASKQFWFGRLLHVYDHHKNASSLGDTETTLSVLPIGHFKQWASLLPILTANGTPILSQEMTNL